MPESGEIIENMAAPDFEFAASRFEQRLDKLQEIADRSSLFGDKTGRRKMVHPGGGYLFFPDVNPATETRDQEDKFRVDYRNASNGIYSYLHGTIGSLTGREKKEMEVLVQRYKIHLMPKQKEFMENRAYGGTMRLGGWDAIVKKGTVAYGIYDKRNGFLDKSKALASERHRHRYEFNDKYTKDFERNGLVISARSVVENLAEIIELPKDKHPFYIATQGHPEYKSRPLTPHPIFLSFIEACLANTLRREAGKTGL